MSRIEFGTTILMVMSTFQRARLLHNREVTIEVVPEGVGKYELLCVPDACRGKLIVRRTGARSTLSLLPIIPAIQQQW